MTETHERSIPYLRWLVFSRDQNQQASLDLYEAFKSCDGASRSRAGRTLVAVGFSLWRAAFLADRTGKLEARASHAETFLLKMIGDNAINYPQDRESREWTFNYYLDNAYYRLDEISDKWPEILENGALIPKSKRRGQQRWTCLQQAFSRAVKVFSDKAAQGEISD